MSQDSLEEIKTGTSESISKVSELTQETENMDQIHPH